MKKFLENDKFIKLTIFDILLTEHGFNVVLQSVLHANKALQILVGFADAQLLTIQFNKVRTTKPLLVDVIHALFEMMQVMPRCAVIYDIQENQFATRIFLENQNKRRFVVETKTSDALAIMMACQGSIFIEKKLFEARALEYNFYEDKGEEEAQQYKIVKIRELKDKLNIAILEERYEDAAMIRDEIYKLQGEEYV